VSHEKQFETRPLAGTAPTSDPERSFGAASWAGLCAALAILVLSLAVSLYRLALPSDGWSVGLFVYAGQAQLIFGRNLLGAPSALHAADVLVAIEGQPAETLLARALVFQPQRPANWMIGETVRYTVQRDGCEVALDVPLRRRPAQLLMQLLSDDPFRAACSRCTLAARRPKPSLPGASACRGSAGRAAEGARLQRASG
jgi:hypothetical protein